MGTPTNQEWREWIIEHFPHVCTAPFSARHERLWEWFDALASGVRPLPRVECWPRGGAKSSTAELACARLCAKLTRRFVLYVCGTQDQADMHVSAVASALETIGVERELNKYGHSRGWRRQQLRTANGFNVAGIGLDAAARGAKLDQYRPDLIIFDDVDDQDDSLLTIEKKVRQITTKIIPAGSPDCAILFIQNAVHEESIMSQLIEDRADFLYNREPAFVEPAVEGLEYESYTSETGRKLWRITAGEPTWAGQDLATCTAQLNDWGEAAFLREAQHRVAGALGTFFNVARLEPLAPEDLPELQKVALAGDLAGTEGGGNHTALVVIGQAENETYPILALLYGQWGTEKVRALLQLARDYYRRLYPNLRLRLPQDGGQAGKDQAEQFKKKFGASGATQIVPVTGKKWTRARGFQEQVNLGNVALVMQDLPEEFAPYISDRSYLTWHKQFKSELRRFKEEVKDQADDIVDAASDGFTAVAKPRAIAWH